MPKKTKKEKLKRLERRGNTQPTTISETHVPTNPIEHTHNTFSFRGSQPTQPVVVKTRDHTFDYLRKDLIKTVVLALLACGILVGLSVVLK